MSRAPDEAGGRETAEGSGGPAAGGGLTTRGGLLVAAAVLVVGAVAVYGYYRWLVGSILEDAPLAFEAPAPPAGDRLHRLEDRLAAARAGGVAATLDQDELNALLFAEVAASDGRAVRLDLLGPGTVRLRSTQRDTRSGRYLNADLTGTMGLLPPEGKLGFVFREGRVGGVSLAGTAGQWARAKIERQLAHEIATNERTGRALNGLADVRISSGRVEFRFVRP